MSHRGAFSATLGESRGDSPLVASFCRTANHPVSPMELISDLASIPPAARGAVVAIGNFDGVHRGHQALFACARAIADALDVPAGVMTFEPHPRQFFRPDGPPFRLTPHEAKARAIAATGMDILYLATFDQALSRLHAADFVLDLIVERLQAVHVVVGPDFHFGRDRSGGPALLSQIGEMEGFGVTVLPQFTEASTIISSTAIRRALEVGDLATAKALLGRPWAIIGPVVKGDQRGRTIGFPTANVALGDYLVPALGVYAVEARLADGRRAAGVANLGRRPTFGKTDLNLETHLFDFSDDLYGQTMDIQLCHFLRPEHKFAGIDALKAQIAADCGQARQVLGVAN